ncbi:MAG: aldo/keto reductase [Solirubrobacterales bacterium]|nr:aldo/keto reductase [Solirubrobacterales bacterium]
MRYRLFGGSGLRVSELCLGTMAFGEDWGWGASLQECARILTAFAEAGGNFIDTADVYTNGSSERVLGELLGADRDRFVLATKYTCARDARDPNAAGNHRKNLVAALDASLKRLRTDYVDVLYVHIWDFLTPVAEVMRALDDQVRAGKVLYVGVSDTPAWIVAHANTLAEERGWTPFSAVQVQYSLAERTIEREYLPMARMLDLAVTAWAPLGMGVLTGKYSDGASARGDGRLTKPEMAGAAMLSERNHRIAEAVREVGAALGASPAQVALAWLLGRPGVVLPIVGTRKAAQLRENLAAIHLTLGAEQLARLEEATAIDRGFPHEFIEHALGSGFVLGETAGLVDNHRAGRSGLSIPRQRVAADPGQLELAHTR